MSEPSKVVIRRPDDWHVHLRDGDMLRAVAPYTARQFGRAIVMPNLVPPVTSAADAAAYRDRIVAALPAGSNFTPLMTLYLTDHADPAEIERGHAAGIFTAAKLYPAHATTNAAHGVSDVATLYPALEAMQRIGMPFLVHGEVTDPAVDIFDREAMFIERVLTGIVRDFPALKIVFEHITTAEGVAFVEGAGPNVAATVTPQHCLINRNAMFEGGIRPHAYCLPVPKRELHRAAVARAATSGSPKFFLGTDSAPHAIERKEAACGCAGIFNAPYALETYATIFDAAGALDKLEAFASINGANFYGLPLNEERVTLERVPVDVPESLPGAGSAIVPFMAGRSLPWRIAT